MIINSLLIISIYAIDILFSETKETKFVTVELFVIHIWDVFLISDISISIASIINIHILIWFNLTKYYFSILFSYIS